MVQRGLQYLAVEMKCGVRIVEQFERRLGGDGALAQQQRHHHARGRSPDRGSDQMLSMLQQFEVGQRRKVGAIGASAWGTNRSACNRSIEDDWRASDNTT